MIRQAIYGASLFFWQIGVLYLVLGIFAWHYPIISSLLFLLMFFFNRLGITRLFFLSFCFILGIFLAYFYEPKKPEPISLLNQDVLVEADIYRIDALIDKRIRLILKDVKFVEFVNSKKLDYLALTWDKPNLSPIAGQKIRANLKIREIRGFLNKGSDGIEDFYHRQNIWYSAWLRGGDKIEIFGEPSYFNQLRANLHKNLISNLYKITNTQNELPQQASFIPALIFNDKSFINIATMELVNKAGLRHSLALSGQHLSVAGVFAIFLILLFSYYLHRIFLIVPRKILIGMLSLPLAVISLWLGDAPRSLIRAFVMLFIFVLFLLFKYRLTIIDALFFALLYLVLSDPYCVFELSVQLSCVAVAGIGIMVFILNDLFVKFKINKIILFVLWILGLALAAQIATLPIILSNFGHLNLSFVLNVFWLPLLSFVVLPFAWLGVLFSFVGLNILADLCLQMAVLPCSWLLDLLLWADKYNLLPSILAIKPHLLEIIGYYIVLVAMIMLYMLREISKKHKYFILVGVLCFLFSISLRYFEQTNADISVSLLDVGHGQAVLIKGAGKRGIIDSGGFNSLRFDSGRDILAPYLTNNLPPMLDFAIISHLDRDHIGGMPYILSNFDLDLFVSGSFDLSKLSNSLHTKLMQLIEKYKINYKIFKAGDRLYLSDDLFLETISPDDGVLLHNNNSLVLRLLHKEQGKEQGLAIFLGDISLADQKKILNSARSISAKVLVLPHHGSKSNYLPELYEAVKPEVVLVSANYNNYWDMPAKIIIDEFKTRQIPLYSTGELGEINVHFKDKLKVTTYDFKK